MSIAVVAHTSKQPSGGTGGNVTSDAIDTTGANLLAVVVSDYGGVAAGSVSDSKGNTWTGLTAQNASSTARCRIFYAKNATVGSGHTFTHTNGGSAAFPGIAIVALSGADTSSPFDQENGATVTGISLQTGSITPTQDNEIAIGGACFGGNFATVDSGFTVQDVLNNNPTNAFGVVLTTKIQSTAAAVNPTFSFDSSGATAVAIASFKAAVVSVPNAPTSPSIENVTPTGFDYSFDDGGQANLTGGKFQYDTASDFSASPVTLDFALGGGTITFGSALTAGQQYYGRFAVTNAGGTGSYSTGVSFTPLAGDTTLVSATVETSGVTLTLVFSRDVTGVGSGYSLSGGHSLSGVDGSGDTWTFNVSGIVPSDEVLTLDYAGTSTVDLDDGRVAPFSAFEVDNTSTQVVHITPSPLTLERGQAGQSVSITGSNTNFDINTTVTISAGSVSFDIASHTIINLTVHAPDVIGDVTLTITQESPHYVFGPTLTVEDTIAPTVLSATVGRTGATLSIHFSEPMAAGASTGADWTLSGTSAVVGNGTITGEIGTFPLSPAAAKGETITIDYAPGTVADAATNALAGFSSATVANSTGAISSNVCSVAEFGYGIGTNL